MTSEDWIRKETDFPKGDPENAVTSEDLLNKFRTLTRDLSIESQNILSDKLLNLENLDTIDDLFEFTKVRGILD